MRVISSARYGTHLRALLISDRSSARLRSVRRWRSPKQRAIGAQTACEDAQSTCNARFLAPGMLAVVHFCQLHQLSPRLVIDSPWSCW